MPSVVRSRKCYRTGCVVATGLAVIAFAAGCDGTQRQNRLVNGEDFSVNMPLAGDSAELSLVAQPPKRGAEVIPTPPGAPALPDIQGKKRELELVPAPPGEPENPKMVDAAGSSAKLSATSVESSASKSPSSAEMQSTDGVASVDASGEAANGEGPVQWESWPTPETVLFVTGNQHGYIEPCGCTGLENQKGGLARRFTLMKQLSDRGWPLVPLDAGNQVRRTGRQAEIKFQTAAAGLAEMKYAAVGFGPEDLRLGVGALIAVAAVDDPAEARFISANMVLIDPSFIAQAKVVESGGRRIGVTSILDPSSLQSPPSDDIQIGAIDEKLSEALALLDGDRADFKVLLFYGSEKVAAEAVQKTAGFDLVVVAGGYGEPTYKPEAIENSQTKMIVTGDKGMYTGLIGLYADAPFRYARVPLTHEFDDAPEMRRLMAAYQSQLKSLGLEGLGLKPVAHPTGGKFVGTKTCGECHTTAFAIWENSSHALATEHIVHPGERGDISRHFDPECLSCHVTGWNPQNYYPYESGYVALEASAHLHGNGCENCHGPGASHSAAEREGSGVAEAERDALRVAMRLPLENARERCMECHDLDNSPDFHKEDAFESYWAEIEHYGLD